MGTLTFILIISLLGVGLIGLQTYIDPAHGWALLMLPVKVIIDKASMIRGQEVFHKYALMEYGSFW